MIEHRGIGLVLEKADLTRPDKIRDALKALVYDRRFVYSRLQSKKRPSTFAVTLKSLEASPPCSTINR